MAQPKFRLSVSRKDKADITYKDYKGNQKTSKYRSFGAIFQDAETGRYWVSIDGKITLDPETYWTNVFENRPKTDDGDEDEKPAQKQQAKVKKQTKKSDPEPAETEDDPFNDE